LGRVGVATTRQATRWGEVSGAFGKVRVNITRSSHYRSLIFYNHFGTKNMELSWGGFRRGETAFVEGEIVVTPSQPDSSSQSLVFEAESSPFHQVGRRINGGWEADTRSYSQGFLTYGPYTRDVASGRRTATFSLTIDIVNSWRDEVAILDVYDADAGRVLAIRALRRNGFRTGGTPQEFSLPFTSPGAHRLEFRVFWKDRAYLLHDKTVVR
jgi:hypothetical protein